VELAGVVVLAPALAWLLTSSLLLGLVSDIPGGSFRFSVKQKYIRMTMVHNKNIIIVIKTIGTMNSFMLHIW
jgi:hypothetical protein